MITGHALWLSLTADLLFDISSLKGSLITSAIGREHAPGGICRTFFPVSLTHQILSLPDFDNNVKLTAAAFVRTIDCTTYG